MTVKNTAKTPQHLRLRRPKQQRNVLACHPNVIPEEHELFSLPMATQRQHHSTQGNHLAYVTLSPRPQSPQKLSPRSETAFHDLQALLDEARVLRARSRAVIRTMRNARKGLGPRRREIPQPADYPVFAEVSRSSSQDSCCKVLPPIRSRPSSSNSLCSELLPPVMSGCGTTSRPDIPPPIMAWSLPATTFCAEVPLPIVSDDTLVLSDRAVTPERWSMVDTSAVEAEPGRDRNSVKKLPKVKLEEESVQRAAPFEAWGVSGGSVASRVDSTVGSSCSPVWAWRVQRQARDVLTRVETAKVDQGHRETDLPQAWAIVRRGSATAACAQVSLPITALLESAMSDDTIVLSDRAVTPERWSMVDTSSVEAEPETLSPGTSPGPSAWTQEGPVFEALGQRDRSCVDTLLKMKLEEESVQRAAPVEAWGVSGGSVGSRRDSTVGSSWSPVCGRREQRQALDVLPRVETAKVDQGLREACEDPPQAWVIVPREEEPSRSPARVSHPDQSSVDGIVEEEEPPRSPSLGLDLDQEEETITRPASPPVVPNSDENVPTKADITASDSNSARGSCDAEDNPTTPTEHTMEWRSQSCSSPSSSAKEEDVHTKEEPRLNVPGATAIRQLVLKDMVHYTVTTLSNCGALGLFCQGNVPATMECVLFRVQNLLRRKAGIAATHNKGGHFRSFPALQRTTETGTWELKMDWVIRQLDITCRRMSEMLAQVISQQATHGFILQDFYGDEANLLDEHGFFDAGFLKPQLSPMDLDWTRQEGQTQAETEGECIQEKKSQSNKFGESTVASLPSVHAAATKAEENVTPKTKRTFHQRFKSAKRSFCLTLARIFCCGPPVKRETTHIERVQGKGPVIVTMRTCCGVMEARALVKVAPASLGYRQGQS